MSTELADSILAHGTTYRLATRWKVTCIVLGILCTALIVMIPFGIVMFVLAGKARVITGEGGVIIKWFGTRVIRWEDFVALRQGGLRVASGGGLVGGAASAMISGPVNYQLVGKKSWGNIAMHWHERSNELADTFEAKTGKQIVGRHR
jgi:hypothetical protein